MKYPSKNERGVITLIAILGVGLFALAGALTIATGTLSSLSKNRNSVSGDQVFYTGESGVSEGAYQYLTASSWTSGSPVLSNNTATGTITVTPLAWPYVKVRGMAANAMTKRTVARVITVFPEGEAFDYAVYTNSDVNFGGSSLVNGNVFSNTEIGFTGNNAEINGDAFTPGDISDTDNVDGTSVTSVDEIPPPILDVEPYRVIAQANGTLFASTSSAKAFLNNLSQTAVIVVEDTDELKLQNSTLLTGSLVVNGDLDLTGGTYNATSTYAAIVVYGDLRVAGGTTINGIVYVAGSTAFGSGNNTINGSLIAIGGFTTDITGNSTINFDPSVYVNWPSLTGLNTTSTTTPEIILWEEE